MKKELVDESYFLKVVKVGNWKISINYLNPHNEGVISGYIECLYECHFDEFIHYSHGKVAYSGLVALPKYVKNQVGIECRKIMKEWIE